MPTLIEYIDGSTQNVISDDSWQTAPGPVTFSSIYGGEDYDANKLPEGWDLPGYTGSTFKKVVIVEGPPLLQSQQEEPLKILDHLNPKRSLSPSQVFGCMIWDKTRRLFPIYKLKVKKAPKLK